MIMEKPGRPRKWKLVHRWSDIERAAITKFLRSEADVVIESMRSAEQMYAPELASWFSGMQSHYQKMATIILYLERRSKVKDRVPIDRP